MVSVYDLYNEMIENGEITPEEVDEKAGIYRLHVKCSKGTYIRTLCADIGAYLGCGAAMSALLRTQSGNFSLNSSFTIKDLEEMTTKERYALIKPTESLFEDCKRVELPDFYARLARSGCEIYQKKIGTSFPVGTFLRIYENGEFLALAEVRDYENGTAIKSIKFFKI